jgi:hypothetical protein
MWGAPAEPANCHTLEKLTSTSIDGVMEKAAFEIGRAGNPAKPNLQGMAVAPLHESNRAEVTSPQLPSYYDW